MERQLPISRRLLASGYWICRVICVLAAVFTLCSISFAQGNAKEIMAKSPAELIEILKDANSTAFERAKACQRLAVMGTKDAIPSLAALLPDEKLNVYARTALENIPGPEAAEALREAAKTLKGRPLVGVIDSLGQMRDAKAIELLAKYLEGEDIDIAVASAAAGALGRIKDIKAPLFGAILNNLSLQAAAADACLDGCALMVQTGSNENIKGVNMMYGILTGDPALLPDAKGPIFDTKNLRNLPKSIRIAAFHGLYRMQKNKAKDVLVKQVHSPDKDFFNVALSAARELPGEEVTKALVAELDILPAERRALLLLAIADRKDKPELAVLVRESKHESEAVRKAAVYALAQRADAGAAKALIDIALSQDAIAAAAKDGLLKIPGEKIDAAIIDKYASADGRTKVVLLDLFGERGIAAALPIVRKSLDDADQPVRLAAIAAAAKLIDVADLDLLIVRALAADRPNAESAAVRSALDVAVLRMGDRDATAARIAPHIDAAGAEQQSFLFDLLRKVSGKKALEEVVARTKSSDPAQKDSATRVLGEWVNTDAAPALLEIAKNDAEQKYRIRALRGYIRIARQLEVPWWEASDAPAVKLEMYDEAMAAAERADEKLLALDILTRIPSAETLSRAIACLDNPALKEKSAATAVAIAGKVIGGNPKAVAEAMRKVIDAKPEDKTADTARQLLERAGG